MSIAKAICETRLPSPASFFDENTHKERNLDHTRPPKARSVRSRKTRLPTPHSPLPVFKSGATR